jgi:hypothetical protein
VNPELYFTAGRDQWNTFKIWEGGLGIWVLFCSVLEPLRRTPIDVSVGGTPHQQPACQGSTGGQQGHEVPQEPLELPDQSAAVLENGSPRR